ncbi:MAG TPA: hypothetical protein VFW24_04975 [Acidimicrobiales bacterium]|nr:hypothetical protein [Acidimicrobiales bacterium]
MSVPVDLEKLRDSVERFGALAYLLTTGADGRPHAVSVHMEWDAGRLVTRAGRRTVANAADRPSVSLLWPPVSDDGFSLIVDGSASVDSDRMAIRPTTAVLHRQASGPGEASTSECVGVLDHAAGH